MLDNRTRIVGDLVQVTGSKENEKTFMERVLVDLCDACTIRGAPKLVLARNKLMHEKCFVHPPITFSERFEKKVAAFEIV